MLSYAIRCNEAWARNDPDKLVGTDSFEYERDLSNAEWWQDVCTLIPKASDAAATAEPTKSDVPVLAFNGEEDPQDPPGNMAGAQRIWPNSLELTVPGQGHDIDPVSAACEIPLIKSFIDQGGVTESRHDLSVAASAALVRSHAPEQLNPGSSSGAGKQGDWHVARPEVGRCDRPQGWEALQECRVRT